MTAVKGMKWARTEARVAGWAKMTLPAKEFIEKKSMPVPESGCWLWTGSIHRTGYGSCFRGGKSLLPHRIAYEAYKGSIPAGMFVCHTCDTRSCVNPDHLWLGTNADNMEDMRSKGRSADSSGAKNPSAKLTWDDVRQIRRDRRPVKEDMARFGVSNVTIVSIRNGRTWKENG